MAEEQTPLKWQIKTGNIIEDYSIKIQFLAVSNGMVYFRGAYDNYLYAVDIKSGEEKWKFEIGDSEFSPGVLDGVVYFVSSDGHLCALDILYDGEKWKFKTENSTHVCVTSPIISEGMVYFGSSDGHLYTVNSKTGEEKCLLEIEAKHYESKLLEVSNGVIYFEEGTDANLYAIDIKTGKEKWKFETEKQNYGSITSPKISEGMVYFGSSDGHLYAVDSKTGEEKWKFETEDFAPIYSSPLVQEGLVLFGSDGMPYLYALDSKTGRIEWKFETESTVETTPVLSEGVVYFGSSDNHFYAVDIRTGAEKWKFETGDDTCDCAYPVVSDGTVYFCMSTPAMKFPSRNGRLFAVEIELAEKLEAILQDLKSEEKERQDKEVADKKAAEVAQKQALEEKRKRELQKIADESGFQLLLKADLLYACWDAGPAGDIYNQSYETEVTHEQADYIENQGLGCRRLEEVDPDADDYDPEETEKIEIDVEDYVDNDFKNDFFSRFDTDELESGEISKEEIEEWINSSVGRLCELFRSFTIHDEDQIYLQVESKEYKLEDLSPDWTDDKYYLDDKKMEYFINTSMEDW